MFSKHPFVMGPTSMGLFGHEPRRYGARRHGPVGFTAETSLQPFNQTTPGSTYKVDHSDGTYLTVLISLACFDRDLMAPSGPLQGQNSAWLIVKRLNLLQSGWRVLVLDRESKCIINRALDSLRHLHANTANPPHVEKKEMLLGLGVERKRFSIDSIEQVIRYRKGLSNELKLTFKTRQRPYQLEFIDEQECSSFCSKLQDLMPQLNVVDDDGSAA